MGFCLNHARREPGVPYLILFYFYFLLVETTSKKWVRCDVVTL